MEDLTTLSSDKHSPEHFQIYMRGQLQEGNIHVVDLCEFASFGSFYRAYFMCNLAEILILSSHCMCNPFVFDLMRIRQPGVEQYIIKKKAKFLAVNCQSHQYFSHYLVSKVLFKAYITSAGIISYYHHMRPCNQFKTSCHHLILTCQDPAKITFTM